MIVKVRVSDSEKSLTQEFAYFGEDLTMSVHCGVLRNFVDTVTEQFKGTADDIIITVKMDW